MKRIHVDAIAPPGDRLATRLNLQPDQIDNRPRGRVFARNPFRIQQRHGTRPGGDGHLHMEQTAWRVGSIDTQANRVLRIERQPRQHRQSDTKNTHNPMIVLHRRGYVTLVAAARRIAVLEMKLAYIRWKDAVAEDAGDTGSKVPQAQLVELQEIGFLLDENDEAVVIGMELHNDVEVRPGRWRLHIPKVSIQEMRVVELDKAFTRRRKKTV